MASQVLARLPIVIDSVERRGSNPTHFVGRVQSGSNRFFIKIAEDGLAAERERLAWLAGKVPTPEVVDFGALGPVQWLLTTAALGTPLSEPPYRSDPALVVRLLSDALRLLHGISPDRWPFGTVAPGDVLRHGDACLPNVLVNDGQVTGFVDLGDASVGSPETDLSAAVWSLQYNLGPGWGRALLERYGWSPVNDAEVERLRLQYETPA